MQKYKKKLYRTRYFKKIFGVIIFPYIKTYLLELLLVLTETLVLRCIIHVSPMSLQGKHKSSLFCNTAF